jgi:hypothetical protein
MSDSEIIKPNIVSSPTADIRLTQTDEGVVQTESFPVIPRQNLQNEFARPVKMSDIIRILEEIGKIKKKGINWEEIAIGVTTLGFGGTLSALITPVDISDNLGPLFYIILPIISFSLTVYVIMHKVMTKRIES